MTAHLLRELEACGQSIWLDYISRELLESGTLARYIEEDGLSGVTANPAIFEKAMTGTHAYDKAIAEHGSTGASPLQIYERIAIEDVGAAADLFRAVYDSNGGRDGFVSIEVSPEIGYDTEASVEEAKRFWNELRRPNVFIKIPATPEGIPAIEALIAEGINVNITLIFAVEVYEQVMEAYLKGLERRVAAGTEIGHIASVASFFVSRVDTLVDRLLEEQQQAGTDVTGLAGHAAIANAKIAYERFEAIFGSERFATLAARGAQVQRPLWASTSTKNPAYPDTMYVAPLIGPQTVNTMTEETIEAFRDHGEVDCGAIRKDVDWAHRFTERLADAGIDMKAVTDQLTREGIEKFSTSLHNLLETIEQERTALVRT